MEGEDSLRGLFFAVVARKGSAVNEFLGRLIEIMAEVGTRSSMTLNHEIECVRTYSTCTVKLEVSSSPLNHCLLFMLQTGTDVPCTQ